MLRCIVLGSAAGGGFPQWNCGCAGCARARAGDRSAKPRSQTGLAVTGDGMRYVLVGASPDLRSQLLASPALAPEGARASPVTDVLLTNADIDGIAGLLTLRERAPFRLLAPAFVLDILAANRVFDVLDRALVPRVPLAPGEVVEAAGARVSLVPMPGKVPLYEEAQGAADALSAPVYAARLEAGGRRLLAAPSCAEITAEVARELAAADLVLFDGTLFTDDEMIRAGLGTKTGRRMGHVPMTGPGGSLDTLRALPGRALYIHMNNSNPVLLADTPEREAIEAAGVGVAEDGMIIEV